MASEWKTVQLKDVCSKIGSGATPKGGNSVYLSEGKFSLIRSQNVRNDSFDHSGLAFIEKHHADKLSNVTVEEKDILLNITGDSVARCCQVDPSVLPARVNQHVAIIRPIPKNVDAQYLRYYFVSPTMQNEMLSMAGIGATRNALTKGMIEGFEIPIPPLPEQKAIAHILGSLDDKIELNRRMNVTLEGMAQAIFKSWFVDFDPVIDNALTAGNPIPEQLAKRAELRRKALADGSANRKTAKQFPNNFKLTDEMGWIPDGWEVTTIVEQVQLTMGQSPSSDHYNKDGKGLPFHQGVTNYGERFPKHEQYSTGGNRHAERGDILFSVRAPVGRINISDRHIIIGRGLSAMRHKKNYQGFLVYFLKHAFQKEDSIGSGTIYNAVNKKEMESIPYIAPTDGLAKAFNDIASSLDEKIASNAGRTQTLTKLRDTLLPKLISGELRIPDAEKLVKVAIV
jgi:type I restriction enzyme, S subunit